MFGWGKTEYDKQIEDILLKRSKFWKFCKILRPLIWVILILDVVYLPSHSTFIGIVCGLMLYFTSRKYVLEIITANS